MQWTRSGFLVSAVAIGTLAVFGCASGPSQEEQQRETEWAWLTEAKQNLDDQRQQLADLKARAAAALEAAAEEEPATPAEVEAETVEPAIDLASEITQLEQEITDSTEEFSERLVGFINADPMIEGEPPTERQIAALQMKSDEDIVLAQEWIEKGGDYKRAIEIYNTALMFDPDNEKLQAALAQAEADRFMSEEKFSQVAKDMTEAEVRQVLGQVNLHNIREYPDRKVVAWFYPTSEDGSAAAVWFQADKSGEMKSYRMQYEAIKPGEEQEGQ